MDKNEAMKRLDAIEAEAKELRRIIEGPQVDPSEWVGKWGFYTDFNDKCPNDHYLMQLEAYDPTKDYPFRLGNIGFRYFRPATAEELGFADEIDFIKRISEIDAYEPSRKGWSWGSLVGEAKDILGK